MNIQILGVQQPVAQRTTTAQTQGTLTQAQQQNDQVTLGQSSETPAARTESAAPRSGALRRLALAAAATVGIGVASTLGGCAVMPGPYGEPVVVPVIPAPVYGPVYVPGPVFVPGPVYGGYNNGWGHHHHHHGWR